MPALDLADPDPIWNGDIVSALLNGLSNLFLLPAAALAAYRFDVKTVIVYTHVFIASNLYHLCRAGVLCVYEFEKHRMSDYLFVYRAIAWTLTRLATETSSEHVALFLFFSGLVYFTVDAQLGPAVLSVVGIVLPLITCVILAVYARRRLIARPWWGAATVLLMAIAAAFMFFAPHSAYWWAHPAWHAFSMTASLTAEIATYRPPARRR